MVGRLMRAMMQGCAQPHEGQAELPLARSAMRDEQSGCPHAQSAIAGARTLDIQRECCWWRPREMKHPKPDSAVLSRKGDVALVPEHTENNRTSRTQLLNLNNQRSNIQNWVKVAGQHQYLLEKKPFCSSSVWVFLAVGEQQIGAFCQQLMWCGVNPNPGGPALKVMCYGFAGQIQWDCGPTLAHGPEFDTNDLENKCRHW